MSASKLFPVPVTSFETFDYQYCRYYHTPQGYFRSVNLNRFFYHDLNKGFVEKIGKKEYYDVKYEFDHQFVHGQDDNLKKGVQLFFF